MADKGLLKSPKPSFLVGSVKRIHVIYTYTHIYIYMLVYLWADTDTQYDNMYTRGIYGSWNQNLQKRVFWACYAAFMQVGPVRTPTKMQGATSKESEKGE